LEKPSFICSALLVQALLLGCGNIRVDLTFDTLNTGTIRLEYEVLPEFRHIGQQNHPLNWPTTQEEWRTLVSRVQGLSLSNINIQDRMGGLTVLVQLQFANLQALESLAIFLGQKFTVIGIQNVYTLNLEYQTPTLATAQLRNLTRLALDGKSITWNVTAPRTVRDSGRAQLGGGGRNLSVTDSLVSVLDGTIRTWRAIW
jgi:hypothetical protein